MQLSPIAAQHKAMNFSQDPSRFSFVERIMASHEMLMKKSLVPDNGTRREEKTIISAVIDRSRSMTPIWADTVAGFDSFLEGQKEMDGDSVYSLRVFDSFQTIVYDFVSANKACTIPEAIKPRLGTALSDAIGEEIGCIRNFQAENPAYTSVVLLVMTDGMENSSRRFSTAQVRNLVQICQSEGWQFIFMGANIDAFATGGTLGFTNTIQYDRRSLHASFVTASSSASLYRRSGSSIPGRVDLTFYGAQQLP